MAFRDEFSDDEWARLTAAPLWVIGAVGFADGEVDAEEDAAGIRQLYQSPLLRGALAKEVMMASYSDLGSTFEHYKGDDRGMEAVFEDVKAILADKVPIDEAVLYKATLIELGIAVAAATGDEDAPISLDEGSALGWIESWLGVSSDEASKIAADYGADDDGPTAGFYL
ncbi:tellurite resistance TerB family protein [bacterium]|nr:tellurite resistance TerB family protein [bacterium]